jgi:hypothetical protein
MINRARDLMRDNPKITTEEVAHTLFEEFHELAKRDHVSDEFLHKMATGHALQMAELNALTAKWKAERAFKKKKEKE